MQWILCLCALKTLGVSADSRAAAASPSGPDAVHTTAIEELRTQGPLLENQEHVKILNGPSGDGAVYDLTGPFAHLHPQEFQEQVLMPRRDAPHSAIVTKGRLTGRDLHSRDAKTPDDFDWSLHGAVAPVRDQGALGACWAISTAETVEGQLAIATSKLTPLAPEQLVECDASVDLTCSGKGPASGHGGCADCGMFGGWPYLAYDFLKDSGGMFSESAWPYRHGQRDVFPCMPDGYDRRQCGNHDDLHCRKNSTKGQGPGGLCHARSGFAVQITGWQLLSSNETELAAQLHQLGPISVLLEASSLQFYRSGIWKGGVLGCKPDEEKGILGLDHAVLLVGYGVEKNILGGETPYWRLKNSWGTRWGESGYFRMLRGGSICGITMMPTIANIAAPASAVEQQPGAIPDKPEAAILSELSSAPAVISNIVV